MHNWKHIKRIRKNAEIIKKFYKKIDENLLKFLISYHGLKDYVQKNKKKFDKEYIKSLFRSHKNPKMIEEKIVFDANMLDNVGKQGIKKALYVGKNLGRSKEDTFKFIKNEINKVKFYTKNGKKLGKKNIEYMKKRMR